MMKEVTRVSAPLGVFDSGIGGISILLEIRKVLPSENILYFADSAHCPYGDKPVEDIRARTLAITEFLIGQGAKAVVVACNTACSAGLDQVRKENPGTPIIGVEPAVKPAHEISGNGRIGILSTSLTLSGGKFSMLVEKFGDGIHLYTQPSSGLADLVEAGKIHAPETRALLEKYLNPLLEQGIDTLILGCTHYPFLKPVIEDICGSGIRLLDTGEAVARQTGRVLESRGLRNSDGGRGTVTFFTTGDPSFVGRIIEGVWPEKVEEVKKAEA
jgi:glutamate racemase